MGLGPYRTLFGAKGLGKMEVRQVLPTPDTAFANIGYLADAGTEVGDLYDSEIIRDEAGNIANVLEHGHDVTIATELQQVAIDQLNLVRNSSGLIHAIRYSGLVNPNLFQYFCLEQARINPKMTRRFNPQKQTLPFRAVALKQNNTSVDIPELYVIETAGRIRTDNLVLWLSPYFNYGSLTTKLLDVSGFTYHGTQNGAPTWNTVPNRLTFDGLNDYTDHGDILDDDGTSDVLWEFWIRILAANSSVVRIMTKKTGGGTSAGYLLDRQADNTVTFVLANGSAAAAATSVATVLQNVWKHIAIAIDRNGNAQMYFNGATTGTPTSFASLGTGTNALSFIFGKDSGGTYFGNFDLGVCRAYNFGAGGLPSDIATIIANHFAAERAIFGI